MSSNLNVNKIKILLTFFNSIFELVDTKGVFLIDVLIK